MMIGISGMVGMLGMLGILGTLRISGQTSSVIPFWKHNLEPKWEFQDRTYWNIGKIRKVFNLGISDMAEIGQFHLISY